jgi:hypothetical protein
MLARRYFQTTINLQLALLLMSLYRQSLEKPILEGLYLIIWGWSAKETYTKIIQRTIKIERSTQCTTWLALSRLCLVQKQAYIFIETQKNRFFQFVYFSHFLLRCALNFSVCWLMLVDGWLAEVMVGAVFACYWPLII